MSKTKLKNSKLIREYRVRAYGYDLVFPVGTEVTNQTAAGPSDGYRFVKNTAQVAREVTGYSHSLLAHDLEYRGINVPAEYCEPWPEEPGYVYDPWLNNELQFARVIEEAQAAGAFTEEVLVALEASMDLDRPRLLSLMERARVQWDKAKASV